MQSLVQAITLGKWSEELDPYKHIRMELACVDGIILRENRILVPAKLRKRLLAIAHESHQGIVRTKALLRGKVWWPGIDSQVEDLVRACIPCQLSTPFDKEPALIKESQNGQLKVITSDGQELRRRVAQVKKLSQSVKFEMQIPDVDADDDVVVISCIYALCDLGATEVNTHWGGFHS
uniref:RNA-directed DNA polymerase n=1 Tax=Strigamia maritima TaxID=126957 RepID=T1IK74_STRMM